MSNYLLPLSLIVVLAGCAAKSTNTNTVISPANTTIANTAVEADLSNPATTKTVADGVLQYQGERLAGGAEHPFLEFNDADYQAARAAGKLIVLDFYASWCPICRAEAPEIAAGFDALESNDVVGFRVHYNDDKVDATQEALAQQFGVTYQHTKVLVRNDAVLHFTLESWTADDLIREVNAALWSFFMFLPFYPDWLLF